MILLVGIIFGLIAGYIRAWLARRPYALPEVQRVELAFIAFLPQAFVFFLPQTGRLVSQQWAAFVLPVSLGILVLFVWYNRRLQGFWLLGLGLLLNLVVIVANGGLMPISPETVTGVYGTTVYDEQAQELIVSRTQGSKNIVLLAEETRLEWLADRFLLPERLPFQFAYSLGDLVLVIGAFWALWEGGAKRKHATSFVGAKRLFLSQDPERNLERR